MRSMINKTIQVKVQIVPDGEKMGCIATVSEGEGKYVKVYFHAKSIPDTLRMTFKHLYYTYFDERE